MLAIRPMTVQDLGAGLHLCRLSRWNQLAEDWRMFLDSSNAAAWLAEKDGEAVGTLAVLRYPSAFAWLSMMLVHPGHRRAGIGSQLIEAALAALADEPCVRLDATPAGEPLYRRFGFVPEYPLARATADSPRFAAPTTARPITPADLRAIFQRDHQIFGADRSALLESLYRRAPALAATSSDGAYCFGRPGYLYQQIGPVVTPSPESAAGLLSHCRLTGPVAIDIPRHSPEWTSLLESAGFTIERPFLRMRRGEKLSLGDPSRQFAIVGPEFG